MQSLSHPKKLASSALTVHCMPRVLIATTCARFTKEGACRRAASVGASGPLRREAAAF
jgi:hypothetical protein